MRRPMRASGPLRVRRRATSSYVRLRFVAASPPLSLSSLATRSDYQHHPRSREGTAYQHDGVPRGIRLLRRFGRTSRQSCRESTTVVASPLVLRPGAFLSHVPPSDLGLTLLQSQVILLAIPTGLVFRHVLDPTVQHDQWILLLLLAASSGFQIAIARTCGVGEIPTAMLSTPIVSASLLS